MVKDFEPDNFLKNLFLTAKAILFSPRLFYENMKTEGGVRNPLIFLICCVVIHTLGASLYVRNYTLLGLNIMTGILMPIVTAGILFLIITRLFKASGTYEAALRVSAYAAATALFSWIPKVGILIEFYRIYLMGLGLTRVFSIKAFQSVLAIVMTVIVYQAIFVPIITHIAGMFANAGP